MASQLTQNKFGDGNALGSILFVEVQEDWAKLVASSLSDQCFIDFSSHKKALIERLRADSASIAAIVLGSSLSEPIAVIQEIHSIDKRMPIFVLTEPAQCAPLRRSLMFSPFLGYEAHVWPTSDVHELPDVLADTVHRRRQRRRYEDACIANAHVQLEVLPTLQPEAAMYLEELLDQQPIGLITTRSDGRVSTINRRAQLTLDVTELKALGKPIARLFPTSERGRLRSLLKATGSVGSSLAPEIFELLTDPAHPRFVEITAARFSKRSGQSGAMFMLQDVTYRVRSEKQRADAILELRQISAALRAVHDIGVQTGKTTDERIRQFLEVGRALFDMPIAVLSMLNDDVLTILASTSTAQTYKPGSTIPLRSTYCELTINSSEPIAIDDTGLEEWRAHPARGSSFLGAYFGVRIALGGELFGTLCFMNPRERGRRFSSVEKETLKVISQWITSELQRERDEAHNKKLGSAIEHAADSVVITDKSGVIEYVNPSFERLTGFSSKEVQGKIADFLQADDQLTQRLWSTIGDGKLFQFPFVTRTKNGDICHQQMTVTPLWDAAGRVTNLIATGRDVTALLKAEETDRNRQAELTHVARLSTLGGMISGLAHELNQPLCAIMTYAQTCVRKADAADGELEGLRHGLNQIISQAQRANEIFIRIRRFSQKRNLTRKRAEIGEVIQAAVAFAEVDLRQGRVSAKLELHRKRHFVYIDSLQVQQVILNLMRNSIDSMTHVDDRDRVITIAVSAAEDNTTKISISDVGAGVAVADANRLFEPFFTTKKDGLGVGLSISQAIVEAHGGKLWLEATSSEGSTFSLTIQNYRRM